MVASGIRHHLRLSVDAIVLLAIRLYLKSASSHGSSSILAEWIGYSWCFSREICQYIVLESRKYGLNGSKQLSGEIEITKNSATYLKYRKNSASETVDCR